MSLKPELIPLIRTLKRQNTPIRKIARMLKISKNTVKKVLRGQISPAQEDKEVPNLDVIRELFEKCGGNAIRVHELLAEKHQIAIGYSTLTNLIREAHLRAPKRRVGSRRLGPGVEMEHDTSPHQILLGGKPVKAQCAAMVLAYSREVYMQYFPRFTRFEARWFISDAIAFFGGSCDRCVVDNTSVLLASGSGSRAVFAPEMVAFGDCYGMTFMAHEIGDADRKPHVERVFWYSERNFLPGREFQDWDDLNRQAVDWCLNVANAKPKRSLGMSPQAAMVMEKPHLNSLPRHLPPVYKVVSRVVDCYGFVHLDTNRYSVPERLLGQRVEVHKHPRTVAVYFKSQKVAEHDRLWGKQNGKITAKGHHQPIVRGKNKQSCTQELALKGHDDGLDLYLQELKRRSSGRGMRQFQRLLQLKRTYPPAAFLSAITLAFEYGLFDLARLENLILQRVAGDFFKIDPEEDWS